MTTEAIANKIKSIVRDVTGKRYASFKQSPSRADTNVWVRWLVYEHVYMLTSSYAETGRLCGADHGTVMNALRKLNRTEYSNSCPPLFKRWRSEVKTQVLRDLVNANIGSKLPETPFSATNEMLQGERWI